MTAQAEIAATNQREFGPDEIGFYQALMAEIVARKALVPEKKKTQVESVATPSMASDAVRMYGSE